MGNPLRFFCLNKVTHPTQQPRVFHGILVSLGEFETAPRITAFCWAGGHYLFIRESDFLDFGFPWSRAVAHVSTIELLQRFPRHLHVLAGEVFCFRELLGFDFVFRFDFKGRVARYWISY